MNQPTNYREMILLKCGEMVLKGLNRRVFEDQLLKNVRHRLAQIGQFSVRAMQSTVYIRPEADPCPPEQIDAAVEAMRLVYGVVSICRTAECEKDMDAILRLVPAYCADALAGVRTFRAEVRRSDKHFPLTSPQIAAEAGGAILEAFPHLSVSLDHPELVVYIEIRDRAAYVHAGKIAGAGGLPVGVGGKAMLLLSGGIDSPVAGHMMAKRGVELAAVHFESPPYTSIRARQKVLDLAQEMSARCGRFPLWIVNTAHIMEEIRDKCPEDLFTLILRRFMMRMACALAERESCMAVITGESLGQVASQTMPALAVTGAVCDRLLFRPLIGMDKEEIIRVARETGTFETSTLPYEDCCTVFTPKHPKTKPRLEQLLEAETALELDGLMAAALDSAERLVIQANRHPEGV